MKSKKSDSSKHKLKKTREEESDTDDSDYIEGKEDDNEISPKQMSIILSMGGGGGMDFGMTVDEEYEQL